MIHVSKKKLLLVAGDGLLLSIAYFLSPVIRFGVFVFMPLNDLREWLPFVMMYLLAFYICDTYDTGLDFSKPKYLLRFFFSSLFGAAAVIVVTFFVSGLTSDRALFVIAACLSFALTYSWRLLFKVLFARVLRQRHRLLIIGAGQSGKSLYRIVKNDATYQVIGFLDDDPGKLGIVNSPAVLGTCALLNKMVQNREVDEIAIAITDPKVIQNRQLLRSVVQSKVGGVPVHLMPSLYEEKTGRIPVKHISDSWFLSAPITGVSKGMYNKKIKRLLDVALSLIGLLCFIIPVLVAVAVAVKVDSPGPVFYRQRRVGRNGRLFTLWKFRSMKVGTENDRRLAGRKDDPRITRSGKVLRLFRIDEFPQLWNVLRGDMSMVGPRALIEGEVSGFESKIPYFSIRHCVRPGITGWAQVNYHHGVTEEDALEKLEYDLFYIKNLSALLDVHILLRTVRVVLFGRGAR
ncbi:MAG: sugar transferase [Syntrophales bacterium]